MSDNRLLGRIKKDVISTDAQSYWSNWPTNECLYVHDLKYASEQAIKYLNKLAPLYKAANKKGIVIFDLDDTLVQGDSEHILQLEEMSFRTKDQNIFILPPNEPIVLIAETAKRLGFAIIILTARPNVSKMASITNLKMFKVPHDALIMNEKDTDPHFKIRIRKQLQKPGQNVILTIGDQWTDVCLPGPKCGVIKLPEADSKCTYILFPPEQWQKP